MCVQSRVYNCGQTERVATRVKELSMAEFAEVVSRAMGSWCSLFRTQAAPQPSGPAAFHDLRGIGVETALESLW